METRSRAKRKGVAAAPTLPALLNRVGKTPEALAVGSDGRFSSGLVYRAGRGIPPSKLKLEALAFALGVDPGFCLAAIRRSDGWEGWRS